MRLLKAILISSVLLMLAAAPAHAAHTYNHPEPPDVVQPDVVQPDVVKGRVITRVPPNAPDGPGRTTRAKITTDGPEVSPGILGTITDAPEAAAAVLPFTGAELTGITLLGLTAIGVGILFSRARRHS